MSCACLLWWFLGKVFRDVKDVYKTVSDRGDFYKTTDFRLR